LARPIFFHAKPVLDLHRTFLALNHFLSDDLIVAAWQQFQLSMPAYGFHFNIDRQQ